MVEKTDQLVASTGTNAIIHTFGLVHVLSVILKAASDGSSPSNRLARWYVW